MGVKTITIDLEAYERLAAEKGRHESFSRVIKRRYRRPTTAANLGTSTFGGSQPSELHFFLYQYFNGASPTNCERLVIGHLRKQIWQLDCANPSAA